MKSFQIKHNKKFSYSHLVFLVSFAIGLLTFDTYAPFTEGWWHVYARWIDLGKVPYRDFELLVPPGYPFLLWGLFKVLGDSFLITRFIGVIVKAITAVLIYRILSGKISKPITASIAILSTELLYSGVASVPFDYNYIAVLFSLMAFERTRAFYYSNRESLNTFNVVYIGLLVSITLLVKQTFGISTLLFASLAIFLATDFTMKNRIRSVVFFMIGVMLPLVFTGLYLLWNKALGDSIRQIFFNSAGTKGGTTHILTSWINGLLTPDSIASGLRYILVIVVIANLWKFLVIRKIAIKSSMKWTSFATLFSTSTIAITFVVILFFIARFGQHSQPEFVKNLFSISRNHFYVDSALMCVILLVIMTANFFSRQEVIMPLAAISFLFGTGLSGGISEYGIFLSVAVSLVYIVSFFGESAVFGSIIVTFVSILVFAMFFAKLESPYHWWSFKSPSIKEAPFRAVSGLSKGLRFSKEQLVIYEKINTFVQNAKKNCGPNIYVYPAMPLFQLNADVLPPGYLANYWYDFSSKSAIDKQRIYMVRNKIDAVVYFHVPKQVINAHSELFQQGKQMPQELVGKILSDYLNDQGSLETRELGTTDSSYKVRFGPTSCGSN